MKKRVLIIGSKGMAGHVIYHYLKENRGYEIMDVSRTNEYFKSDYLADVTQLNELKNILHHARPDFVVNCIGILNQEAENNPGEAILLNSYLPHFLADLGSSNNFSLIHISTDCVFSGKRGNYREDDPKDGTGLYAQTKLLGEVMYGNHATLRTSIIGPELKSNGIGLFDWFMKQDGPIKGYTGAVWTGVTTIALAKVIVKVMENGITGLHHVVNGIKITKFELLMLVRKYFNRQLVNIEPFNGYAADKSLLSGNIDFSIGSYDQMIIEMKEWIIKHQQMYPSYYL